MTNEQAKKAIPDIHPCDMIILTIAVSPRYVECDMNFIE